MVGARQGSLSREGLKLSLGGGLHFPDSLGRVGLAEPPLPLEGLMLGKTRLGPHPLQAADGLRCSDYCKKRWPGPRARPKIIQGPGKAGEPAHTPGAGALRDFLTGLPKHARQHARSPVVSQGGGAGVGYVSLAAAGRGSRKHVRWPVGCGLRVLVDPRPFTSMFLPVCPAVDFPGTFLGERAEGIRFHGLFRARSSAAGAFLASASLLVSVLFMAPS